jgi:lycopene cyclase domain-containing protein
VPELTGIPEYSGIPEYTVLAVLSAVAVVVVERFWLRTGVFRQAQYWIALGIIAVFQVIVDGWLTKLSAPIVLYDDAQTVGLRIPWDIPVEDFLFGFSMVTLTIMLWVRQGDSGRPSAGQGEHEKAQR